MAKQNFSRILEATAYRQQGQPDILLHKSLYRSNERITQCVQSTVPKYILQQSRPTCSLLFLWQKQEVKFYVCL